MKTLYTADPESDMSIEEHLAAKGSDISLKAWWRLKLSYKAKEMGKSLQRG